MRSTLLATLILAPVLAHAQAPSQVSGSLQARAEAPKALVAAAADNSTHVRVSTGVSQPKLIGSPRIALSDRELDREYGERKVVVSLLVDKDGTTKDVAVLQSINKDADEKIVEAVKNFHFVPAQLDAEAIPVHVNLSIVLQP